jgi:leader peptidase (prepilin peptidase) / N-methyltransferase
VAGFALAVSLCALLAYVTATDLERRVIPNRALALAATAALAIATAAAPASLPERVAAAMAAGGPLLAVALVHPRGLGMGDAKLAAVMGLYLGWSVAPALVVAFGAGAVAGTAELAGGGRAARKRAIPFAPFLALGGLVGLAAGPAIVDWYAGSLLAAR